MRILLVEDEQGVVRFVTKGLAEEGFLLDSANSAEIAMRQVQIRQYDLLILDVSLPQMSGTEFLALFRQQDQHTPVLVLTVKDSIDDKRRGFESGCDDYLTKPFHFEELLLRVKALLRRRQRTLQALEVGSLRLEPEAFKVFVNGQLVALTKKEFALLHYFMDNREKVLSRTQILQHVWQNYYDIGSNVVDVTVNSLRKKIHGEGVYPQIVTIYGIGYALQGDSPK